MQHSSFDAEVMSSATPVPPIDFHYDDFHRSRDLEFGQLAKRLAALAEQKPSANGERIRHHVTIDAGLVRRLIGARHVRLKFLPSGLFADPVWDMMLDLTAAKLEGR